MPNRLFLPDWTNVLLCATLTGNYFAPCLTTLGSVPPKSAMTYTIRPFVSGDEQAVSALICRTLAASNTKDYPPEFIQENIRSHSPEVIRQRAAEAHFYVVCDANDALIGCGGITGYWGSLTESYLVSIFVAPDHQRQGIGRLLMSALEADDYFLRAWRTEVGSSLTAVNFYHRLGYSFKKGVQRPDEFGVVRLEKVNRQRAAAAFPRLRLAPLEDIPALTALSR